MLEPDERDGDMTFGCGADAGPGPGGILDGPAHGRDATPKGAGLPGGGPSGAPRPALR